MDTQIKQKLNDLSNHAGEGGDTSPGYLIYRALLSQTDTDAPVATVLENTLGEIVWTRNALGKYLGNLANAFTADKTFPRAESGKTAARTFSFRANASFVWIWSIDKDDALIEYNDAASAPIKVEILVYP